MQVRAVRCQRDPRLLPPRPSCLRFSSRFPPMWPNIDDGRKVSPQIILPRSSLSPQFPRPSQKTTDGHWDHLQEHEVETILRPSAKLRRVCPSSMRGAYLEDTEGHLHVRSHSVALLFRLSGTARPKKHCTVFLPSIQLSPRRPLRDVEGSDLPNRLMTMHNGQSHRRCSFRTAARERIRWRTCWQESFQIMCPAVGPPNFGLGFGLDIHRGILHSL